jgi:NRPS condensation-like uncharacterized protein
MALDVPFSAIDEGIYHLELATNPWNIQAEVGTRRTLDLARLNRAVSDACARHPMARAAMQSWVGRDKKYRWMIADVTPVGLVEEVDDGRGLDAVRTELYGRKFDLETSPNVRAVVVRRAGGDLFLLSVSHVVADGVGVVRLLQSISRGYRGVDDPADPVELETARDLVSTLTPAGPAERRRRTGDNLRMLGDAIEGPARIATTSTSGDEGYGFVSRVLGQGATSAIFASKPEGTTLNDVLIAALQLTIDRWNEKQGVEAGRVVVMMPFNVRPADRFHDVVSNIVTFVNVATDPEDRTSFESTVLAVSQQSAELKKARGAGLHTLANLGRNLPVALKRRISRLLPLTGYRFVGTAVLSNLGRLPETPTFEEDGSEPPELWFSPPCAMPLGVGVGVATVDGRLHLMVRYRQEQFEPADADTFADLLVDQVGPND